MPSPKVRTKTPAKRPARSVPKERLTLDETMRVLEKAGSAQARKTYARHGAAEPMFGVSFAALGELVKRIGVDHELAMQLWETGNFDAGNLALKIADPARVTAKDLDRWARVSTSRLCSGYVSMLAAEGPRGADTAARWLAAKDDGERHAGWALVGQLAARDDALPDAWFAERLAEIERGIHAAPDARRHAMNQALIAIGGRTAGLRKAALAAAKRIGPVEVDHGDTACKTPAAAPYIEKMWAHAKAKGFESPSAQERKRKPPRIRC